MRSERALTRVVFSGLIPAEKERRVEDARAIFAETQRFGIDNGVSGQLVFVNGYYLGLIDGPTRATNALLRQIQADKRLQSNTLLLRAKVNRPTFHGWSGALVDRTEAPAQTGGRLDRLKQRLISDPRSHAVDYFRLICSPNPGGFEPTSSDTRAVTKRVLFAGPSVLWGATALQKIATKAAVPTGRTTIEELTEPYKKTLVEYVDLIDPQRGPIRLTYTHDGADGVGSPGVFSLLDGVDVLVLFALSSDLDRLAGCIEKWVSAPSIQAAQPQVMIASSLSADRIMSVLQNVEGIATANIACVKLGLNDAGAVLQEVFDQLDARFSSERPAPTIEQDASGWMPEPLLDEPQVAASEAAVSAATRELQKALVAVRFTERWSQIEGLVHAAALRTEPAMVLSSSADGAQLRAASVAHADWLSLVSDVMRSLSPGDHTEDIMLTTDSHIYLFRALPFDHIHWLAVTLNRQDTNGGVARLLLTDIVNELVQARTTA